MWSCFYNWLYSPVRCVIRPSQSRSVMLMVSAAGGDDLAGIRCVTADTVVNKFTV